MLNSYGLISIMEDPLHSAIEKFFSKIRPEPKRVFHGRGQLFPEYSHVPKAKVVESIAAAQEFLDRFLERILKIFCF